MRVRKVNSNDVKIHDLVQVKLKTAGNTLVAQFTAGNNKTCTIRNLSKDTYLDVKTGEVRKKKKSESRYQSPKSVRKNINRLMDLIRCNATDSAKCKWLTVTYKDMMTDGKQAFLDAKLFLRKLKRYLAKQIDITSGQQSFHYITIAEPQGERHGNYWHLHILLIFEDTAPFIENETITELWDHGITFTHKVFDGDGLALYFKVYLSDIEYEDDEDEDNTDKPKSNLCSPDITIQYISRYLGRSVIATSLKNISKCFATMAYMPNIISRKRSSATVFLLKNNVSCVLFRTGVTPFCSLSDATLYVVPSVVPLCWF